MISAPYLEVAVVVLGTIILLVESFTSQLDRRFLGYAALFGLAMIFIATFFVAPQSSTASAPLWTLYSADALSLFFKRIALASTAGVLVMMLDFAPSVSIGVQGATRQAGLGEFFTIPLFGGVLVIVALGFKIAAVPFHIWVADVYQGAPTPVTAYLSVGSKAAGFIVLLRVLEPFLILPQMRTLLVAIAVLTLIYGNLAALPQTNVKRLLAYSSIAHAGYLLVAVVSFSGRAVAFYLAAYLLMTLLSVAVPVLVWQGEGDQLENSSGLSQR